MGKPVLLVLVFYLAAANGSPLSNEPHTRKGKHSADYDHEAFLGKDLKKTFDELTPAESLHLLGKIVDKIDKDGNGVVTEQELRYWINFRMHHYIDDDAKQHWNYIKMVATHYWPVTDILNQRKIDYDEPISWEMYYNSTFGKNMTKAKEEKMKRDEIRWTAADKDNSDSLSEEEFKAFLHPQGFEHTKVVYVREHLDSMDKDKDGFVSLDEYLDSDFVQVTKESDPEEYEYEKKQFKTYRDKNKDGKIDMNELWEILLGPIGDDPVVSETKHLMKNADSNEDGMLSRQEILDNHDLFVGSSATNFGEDLPRHDEF